MHMQTIGCDELKARLDRGEPLKLVLVMPEWAYDAKHIPGSFACIDPQEAFAVLDPDDEIIVYCSDPACMNSTYACGILEQHGYRHVYHYAGGLVEWEAVGYPLEGERA
jgi:rhodanese-related sulfurtransferase